MHKINSTKSNQTKFFPLQSEDKNILFSLNPEAKEEDGGQVLFYARTKCATKRERERFQGLLLNNLKLLENTIFLKIQIQRFRDS